MYNDNPEVYINKTAKNGTFSVKEEIFAMINFFMINRKELLI